MIWLCLLVGLFGPGGIAGGVGAPMIFNNVLIKLR